MFDFGSNNGKKTLKHSDFLYYNRWQQTQIRI